jgi:hypothetical protein
MVAKLPTIVVGGGMRYSFIAFAAILLLSGTASAEDFAPAKSQITAPIDDAHRVALTGNTWPEANVQNDGGMNSDQMQSM